MKFIFEKSSNLENQYQILLTHIKALKGRVEYANRNNLPFHPEEVAISSGKKTNTQLRAFYSARDQLMPPYNARQAEKGEPQFFNDEFKHILKVAGGWYTHYKNQFIPKSFTKISKKDMINVLERITIWSIKNKFSLCIDKQLMDLIK